VGPFDVTQGFDLAVWLPAMLLLGLLALGLCFAFKSGCERV
jgi:hypothetical protein